jgi:hypothetical protein
MIKITHHHFNRLVKTIRDAEQQIANKPNANFDESYNEHIAALRKLILELEVVDHLPVDQAIAESGRLFRRMNFFKGISV